MEGNSYVLARKVGTEKLPEHVQNLLHIDEEAINDESIIERSTGAHEKYMENLAQIRENLA